MQKKKFTKHLLMLLTLLIALTALPLTVNAASKKVSISAKNCSIYAGTKNKALSVRVSPKAKVTFTSMNPKVLTVTKNGKVTARNVGTAKVKIKAVPNNKKYSSSSKTITVKVVPQKTAVTALTRTTATNMKMAYKKVNGVTGYQVRYSTNSKMKNAKTKNTKSTSFTLNGFSLKKTYYVQVRTFKKVGKTTYYSGWTGMKALKTNAHTHTWATKTQTKTVTVQQAYTETVITQHFVCSGCGADFTSEDEAANHGYGILDQSIMEGREPDQSHMGYSTYNTEGTINHPAVTKQQTVTISQCSICGVKK